MIPNYKQSCTKISLIKKYTEEDITSLFNKCIFCSGKILTQEQVKYGYVHNQHHTVCNHCNYHIHLYLPSGSIFKITYNKCNIFIYNDIRLIQIYKTPKVYSYNLTPNLDLQAVFNKINMLK